MKKLFSILVGMLVATTMMAQNPVITFEKETHDFGQINEADGRVTTVFNFKNEGASPLVLSNVRASCGCTTPKWTKEPIEPGATGTITVTYNPTGRPGKFSKTITITSNASEQTKRIYIKGDVLPKPSQPSYPVKIGELSLASKQLNMGDIYKGQTKKQTIEYANLTSSAVKVAALPKVQYVDAQVSLPNVDPQKSGQLTVIFDANTCQTYGPVKEVVYMSVNGKTAEEEAYAITVMANIKEDFSQMTEAQKINAPIADIAKEINLGILPKGKAKVTKGLRLTNAGTDPLYIRRILAQDDMQFPVIKGGLKSGKKEIRFNVNTTKMNAGTEHRTITIITNDPKNPVQTVKLTWEVQ